jgi:hypothetical protein
VAFPADQLGLAAELFISDRWVDISGDVRESAGVTIRRGSSSEDRVVPPARCTLTLNDRELRYSPRNPLSDNHTLLGRNTPLRLALRQATDDFAGRTVSNGWGTSADGHVWSTGSALADYAVTGGAATHTISTTVSSRLSYLATEVHRDVDVLAVVDLAPSNITGGDLEPINVLLRGVSATDYYMVRVVITSAEVITVKLMATNGPDYSSTVTLPVVYSGQQLAVRAQMEGTVFRAKVWVVDTSVTDSLGEPYDWDVSAQVPDTRSGWVGVRSGVGSGNTNVPVVFSYTRFEVRCPRYAGEVSAWPPRWDTTARDRTVPIEAAGILRRLGQGQSALLSTLRRSIPTLTNLRAYWPCEDGRDASSLASGVDGGSPMILSGSYSLAASEVFAASDAIPTLGVTTWKGSIAGYTGTGEVQLRYLLAVPAGGMGGTTLISRVYTTGSIGYADLYYEVGGALHLYIYDPTGTLLADESAGFALDGALARVSVELEQSGSDVYYRVAALEVGARTGGFFDGTVASRTVSAATEVGFVGNGNLNGTAIGHITVESATTSLFDLHEELAAYSGETATDRLTRLCAEEGVPLAITGTVDDEARMGPQRPGRFLDLLRECADVDQGRLGEARGTAALLYRTRASLYNQTAVTVDYSAGELSTPFEPTDDDLTTRNDITVQRTDGSTARAVLESGRMSVLDPAEGGAGRYTTRVEVNTEIDDQLQLIADWLLHLGTVDGQRYPAITFDLAAVAGNTALTAGALSLDGGDRVLLTGLGDLGIHDDVDLLATGYSEHLRAYGHRLVVTCEPGTPYRILTPDDADYDRLDSGTSTLTSSLTSSATSFQVTTTDPLDLWTTDAGDFPLSIMVGGERITISAITGSSSPQTFTASARAANGVSKAHLAGAEVHIADINYLGL